MVAKELAKLLMKTPNTKVLISNMNMGYYMELDKDTISEMELVKDDKTDFYFPPNLLNENNLKNKEKVIVIQNIVVI